MSEAAIFTNPDGGAGATSSGNESAVPGISPGIYGARDFETVAAMVRAEAGIVLPPGKAMLVYSRLAPLVRASGLGTFAAYLAGLAQDGEARRKAVNALTTNHTFFYREEHHFQHFAQEVRPHLCAMLGRGEAVRLWSAGCSSGEETWSLAMTLLGPDRHEGKMLAHKDIKILASDIADHALARASAATYDAKALDAVPTALCAAWTQKRADAVTIAETLREMVQFRRLNLHGDWPLRRRFQTIFCRNVMIYFDQSGKEALLARFARQLEPGGYLYIGHSERVSGPAETLLENVGPTIYRRRPQ